MDPLAAFTGRPTRNYAGSVDIRMFGVSARSTPECRLAGPIALVCVPASGTLPTGIARVHGKEWNPRKRRFVLQECPELRERPTVQNRSLLMPGLDPFADAAEVFDGDSATGSTVYRRIILTIQEAALPLYA